MSALDYGRDDRHLFFPSEFIQLPDSPLTDSWATIVVVLTALLLCPHQTDRRILVQMTSPSATSATSGQFLGEIE